MSSSIDAHDADITSHFTSGSIKGYLDIINGKGSYAGIDGNDFKGTLYYTNALNTFAATFADKFNTLNNVDASADNGDDLFRASGDTVGDVPVTALNIAISNIWLNNTMAINPAVTASQRRHYEPV